MLALMSCDRYFYLSLNGQKHENIITNCGLVEMNVTVFIAYRFNISIEDFSGKAYLKNFELDADGESLNYKIWYENDYFNDEYINVKDSDNFVIEVDIPDSLGKVENFSLYSHQFLVNNNENCEFEKYLFQNKILDQK